MPLSRLQEFRRGYPMLLAAMTGSGTGVAVLIAYGLGAFIIPFGQEFGWSRAQVTAAPLPFAIGVLLAGAAAGALSDRFGARKVALTSQLLLAAGLAGLVLVGPAIWSLYLAFLLLPLVAAGTLPVTWTRAVIGWFVAGRGLALGLSLLATGLIGALLPAYLTWLIGLAGWRAACLGLAAVPLFIGLPVAMLFFREPAATSAESTTPLSDLLPVDTAVDYSFASALRTLSFWQLCAAFVLAAICVGAVLAHLLPMLVDRGIATPVAAALAGLFGLSVTLGRLISGHLLDVFGGRPVALVMFGCGALACSLLLVSGQHLLLSGLAIVLVGMAAGGEADIGAYVTARYFGRAHYGAIYGLFYSLYGVGAGAGPWLAGLVYDHTGSYRSALAVGVAGFAVAAALAGTLQAPVLRRVGAPA